MANILEAHFIKSCHGFVSKQLRQKTLDNVIEFHAAR